MASRASAHSVMRIPGFPVICPKGNGSFAASYEESEGIHIYRHPVCELQVQKGTSWKCAWALAAEFWLLALKVFVRLGSAFLQGCNPPDTIFLIGLFFKLFGVRFIL